MERAGGKYCAISMEQDQSYPSMVSHALDGIEGVIGEEIEVGAIEVEWEDHCQ